MSRAFAWVPRQVDPIALDIGGRIVRVLQLARQRSQTSVVACGQRVLPPGPHSPQEREELCSRAVREILAGGRFIGRRAVTMLAWDDLQVRSLRLPNMPEAEIGEVIRFEAAERFGFEPDAAEFRFIVAGDVRQGTEIRQEVMVFGASREAVDRHIAMLRHMGLEPAALDAGPCAVFRGFERFLRRDEDRGEVNAFVDIGYSGSRVVVSRGAEIIFFKAIPIGGREFDALVGDRLELSLTEAADLRVRLHRHDTAVLTGQPPPGGEDAVSESTQRAVTDAIRPSVDQLSKEIALCLRYCSVTFRGLRSREVTVVGGESCSINMLRLLSDHVNIPFVVGKPMRNIACDSELDGADRRSGQPEWATVAGLALKPVRDPAEAAA